MRFKFKRYPLYRNGSFLAHTQDNCPRYILFENNNIRQKELSAPLVRAQELIKHPVGLKGDTLTHTYYPLTTMEYEYQVTDGMPLVTVALLHPAMVSMVFQSNEHPDDVVYCAGFLADMFNCETKIVYVAPLTTSLYGEMLKPRYSVHAVTLSCSGTQQEIVVSGVNTSLWTSVVHTGMRELEACNRSGLVCSKPTWDSKPRCLYCEYVHVCKVVDEQGETHLSTLRAL